MRGTCAILATTGAAELVRTRAPRIAAPILFCRGLSVFA
jgi:hypothetical protein